MEQLEAEFHCNENMNIEEPGLDLSHVKTKNNVDVDQNPTSNTEAVTPRIPVLMMDTNSDKQHLVPIEASETYLMPQLTDNLQVAEEANHQEPNTLEIDELNGNQKSDVQASSEVVKSTDLIISNDEQHKDNIVIEKIKDDTKPAVDEGEDGGDMDIGVDLSLDESGVLEIKSTNVTTLVSGDDLTQEPTSRDAPTVTAQLPDLSPAGNTEASAPDQAGLYPVVEDSGDKHKPSGKRVTFPSDEDIVSGAVEPKDPWRHGNMCVCLVVSNHGSQSSSLPIGLYGHVSYQKDSPFGHRLHNHSLENLSHLNIPLFLNPCHLITVVPSELYHHENVHMCLCEGAQTYAIYSDVSGSQYHSLRCAILLLGSCLFSDNTCKGSSSRIGCADLRSPVFNVAPK